MGAPCKLRFSKLGKATPQTSVLLKRHSITVPGAIAKRGSANTPKKWKVRRLHDFSRWKRAATFVSRNRSGCVGRSIWAVSYTNHVDWLSREAGGKYKCTCSEGVRGAHWTDRIVVEPRPHVFT